MVILGIDPGTAIVGYGVVSFTKSRKKNIKVRDFGIIETFTEDKPEMRLKTIYQGVSKLLKKFKPQILAIENIYFFKNLKTALPISQAKGVIMLAAAQKKVQVLELTPLQVKMAICGYGQADKKQVQKMVQRILKLKKFPKPDDAADALAIALCGAYVSFLVSKNP